MMGIINAHKEGTTEEIGIRLFFEESQIAHREEHKGIEVMFTKDSRIITRDTRMKGSSANNQYVFGSEPLKIIAYNGRSFDPSKNYIRRRT